MPSSLNGFPTQGGFPTHGLDPVAPMASALKFVLTTGEHVLIGALIGLLIAAALQRLQLHWSWGLVALALLILGPLPAGLAWIGAAASLVATLRMRRVHHRRLAEGGQRARRAARSAGPLDALLLLWRAGVRRRRIRAGSWFDGGSLLIGYDAQLRPVEIELLGDSGGRHHLVLGAAGSGKTVTMTWIAVRAIERGLPVVVVDPKDDTDLCGQVRLAAANAGKPVIEWTPTGPAAFNPFACGEDGEIADKALAGETFTEPHYLRQAQRYVGHAVRALRSAGLEVSIASLVEQLHPERLEKLLRDLPEGAGGAGQEYLDTLTPRQLSDLTGMRDRLALVAESDAGRWLDPRAADAPSFELLGALRAGAVVLFRLRSDRRPLLMQTIGGAILLDLQTTSAALQGSALPAVAVIDEFAALSAGRIGGLFARARGAGVSLVLGTQELADLELAGSDALRKQVTGNLTTLIAHRQVNPESADWVSEFSGDVGAGAAAASGRGRPERVVLPGELRSLPVGCAAVIGFSGRRGGERLDARVARMLSVQQAR